MNNERSIITVRTPDKLDQHRSCTVCLDLDSDVDAILTVGNSYGAMVMGLCAAHLEEIAGAIGAWLNDE